jgi:hypothetical protein
MTITIKTYGLTIRARDAIVAAGGNVRFEHSPGRPAFFAPRQPVIDLPPGCRPIDRPGRFSPVGFILPSGLRITADCICLRYRLRSGPQAENGPGTGGAGDWGQEIKES